MDQLELDIKKKRIRKILLAAIVVVAIVSSIAGLKIEKASKLNTNSSESSATTSENRPESKGNVDNDTEEDSTQPEDDLTEESSDAKNSEATTSGASESSKDTTKAKDTVKTETKKSENTTKKETTTKDNGTPITVTLQIRCDTLSKDTSVLSNQELVPYASNPVILSTTVKCTTKTSVADILKTACNANGIQYDITQNAMYGAYVNGINYLYEKDAGAQSGWKYRVNGSYPNYGCGYYFCCDGDTIIWDYVLTA